MEPSSVVSVQCAAYAEGVDALSFVVRRAMQAVETGFLFVCFSGPPPLDSRLAAPAWETAPGRGRAP